MRPRLLALILAAGLCTAGAARAELLSLYDAWQKATLNETTWRAAQADADADRAEADKALAGLLPTASISASRSRNDTDRTVGSSTTPLDYRATSNSLAVRQPLFRMQSYSEYRRADSRREVTEHKLEREAQALAVKVAQAYFDALLAEDTLRLARFQETSLGVLLEGARKAFRAGTGTRIDIDETQARLAMAVADRQAADNAGEIARRQLAALVGSPAIQVLPLDENRLDSLKLAPAALGEWLAQVHQGSPELAAAAKAVEEAEWAVARARAGHLPTVDLVASRTRSESDSLSTINVKSDTSSVGVQLNVPLFAGGYVVADTSQAQARLRRAAAEKDAVERDLDTRLLKEFNGVVQGEERLRSLVLAREASRQALHSTRRGIEAGTRSTLDVLNAERDLNSRSLDAARARYDWLMSRLRLFALAGRLGDAEIKEVSGLLSLASQPEKP